MATEVERTHERGQPQDRCRVTHCVDVRRKSWQCRQRQDVKALQQGINLRNEAGLDFLRPDHAFHRCNRGCCAQTLFDINAKQTCVHQMTVSGRSLCCHFDDASLESVLQKRQGAGFDGIPKRSKRSGNSARHLFISDDFYKSYGGPSNWVSDRKIRIHLFHGTFDQRHGAGEQADTIQVAVAWRQAIAA